MPSFGTLNQGDPTNHPTHPENALLDFQRHTAPALYLSQIIQENGNAPERVHVLCQAVQLVHERAEEALEEVVRW